MYRQHQEYENEVTYYWIGHQENLLYSQSGDVSEQAAQGGSKVIIPRGVEEACRYDTSEYGLMVMVVELQWDSIFRVSSRPNDSMILFTFM